MDTIINWNNKLLSWNNGIIRTKIEKEVVVPTDYIAFFQFQNNWSDTAGNYTLSNSGASFNSSGKVGYCASFPGTYNNYVSSNMPISLFYDKDEPYSISVWLKFTSTTKGMTVTFSSGSGCLSVFVEDSKIKYYRHGGLDVIETGIKNDGNWHHFVGTYDTNKIYGYLDGDLVNSHNQYVDLNVSGTNLVLGRHGSYEGVYYNGYIDQLSIYDRCISAAEVKALYNDGDGI